MKNRNIAMIIAALCVVIMGACFSSWDGSGEQGNIVINLGDGGARGAWTPDPDNNYTVILANSGVVMERPINGRYVVIPVTPGFWGVAVRGEDEDNNVREYGETRADVEVKAGATVSASITMTKEEWKILKGLIEGTKNKPGRPFSFDISAYVEGLDVSDPIQIPSGKDITLWARAKRNVTIKKADGGTFDNSMFRVPSNSSLTLGVAGGMQGTITFDGNKEKYIGESSSSLIYVGDQRIIDGKHIREGGDGGTLTIYDGVILKNNYAKAPLNDRGGAVVVDNGIFRMYGGEISGNTNTDKGGGVRVLSGTFTKTGGTIYGNETTFGDKINTATFGQAVYGPGTRQLDTTLGPDYRLE